MSSKIILHVEDDDNWIQDIKRILQDIGYGFVFSAKTLESAKKKYGDYLLNQQAPDLVILDISLALEDKNDRGGFEFVESLKNWGFTDKTSIIILSNNVNAPNMVEVLRNYKMEVANVFSKSELVDEMDNFIETVEKCMNKPNLKFWPEEKPNADF